MSFLLVDQITALESGRRARGRFAVPKGPRDLSPCLAAEAVGQLAAWVAMAEADFRTRPVAGLAAELKVNERVIPGTLLDLEVELESCERDAVLYGGRACVEGLPIVELTRCMGPMLPMEDFDAPEVVRERFELLCGAGAPLQGFSGDIAMDSRVVQIDRHSGKRLRAEMQVPASAAFFADHFPRKPVLPGTILLDAQVQLAVRLAAEVVDQSVRNLLRPSRVRNVKLRSFVHPGQALEITAEVLQASRDSIEVALTATVGGQRVSTARVETTVRGLS